MIMQSTLSKIETHQTVANHRIEKLEHAQLKDIGIQEERQRWQEKEAGEHKQAIDRVYKTMGLALTAAGIISGTIFSVIDKFLK